MCFSSSSRTLLPIWRLIKVSGIKTTTRSDSVPGSPPPYHLKDDSDYTTTKELSHIHIYTSHLTDFIHKHQKIIQMYMKILTKTDTLTHTHVGILDFTKVIYEAIYM